LRRAVSLLLLALLLACLVFFGWRQRRRQRADAAIACLSGCLLGAPLERGEAPSARLRALTRSAVGADRNLVHARAWPAACSEDLATLETRLDAMDLTAAQRLTVRAALGELQKRLTGPLAKINDSGPALEVLRANIGAFGSLTPAASCGRAPPRRRYELSELDAVAGALVPVGTDVVALDQGSAFWLLGGEWSEGQRVEAGVHTDTLVTGDRARRAAPVAWSWYLFGDELANRIFVSSSRGGVGEVSGLDLPPPSTLCGGPRGEVVLAEQGRLSLLHASGRRPLRGGERVPLDARCVRDLLVYRTGEELWARRLDFDAEALGAAVALGQGEILKRAWNDECVALALGSSRAASRLSALVGSDGSGFWRQPLDLPTQSLALDCTRERARVAALGADGVLTRQVCTRAGCESQRSALGDLDASAPALLGLVGEQVWVVWRTQEGDVRLRVAGPGPPREDRLLFEDALGPSHAGRHGREAALIRAKSGWLLLWPLDNPSPLWFVVALGDSSALGLRDGSAPQLSVAARPGVVHLEWQRGSLWRASAGEELRRLAASTAAGSYDDRALMAGESYAYCVSTEAAAQPPVDCAALSWQRAP
jgi:hypothetical protein